MKRPKQLDLKAEDLEALLQRVEKGSLQEGDYDIIRALVEAIALLSQSLDDKATARTAPLPTGQPSGSK